MSGFKSYLIAGSQSDFDTPAILSETTQKIYEFVSSTIKNSSELISPERFKGNPSPVPGIENIVDVTGGLTMHLHADEMVFWWKQIMYSNPTSTFSSPETLRYNQEWTSTMSLDDQPGGPSKLTFIFSVNVSGWVKIEGTDQNGNTISETLVFSNNDTKTTSRYFASVKQGGITTDIQYIENGTLEIRGNKNVYTHVFTLGDDVPSGFTIELVKGIPSVYVGCIVNTATINLADIITLELGILGKRGYNSHILSTSEGDRNPVPSLTPSSLSGFTRISEQVFPSWGSKVEFDTGEGLVTIPVQSWTLTLDNNLRYLDRFSDSRWRTKPVRGGNRNYSLRATIDYNASTENFNKLFLYNEVVSAKVYCFRRPGSGAEYSLTVELPRCQITAFPDPEVTDYSAVVQEISLRPLRTGTTSDELNVVLKCVSGV